MSRHSKRSRANPRTRHQRGEAKAKRRATRAAKGRTKPVASNVNAAMKTQTVRFVGGIPQQTPSQLTRAMLGLTTYR